MDKILIPEEVAPMVRRPPATLQYWRSMGIGPKYGKIAGRVVYRQRDVEQWVAEQFGDSKVGGGPDAA